MEYQIGGWVKCIASYRTAQKGKYYQITNERIAKDGKVYVIVAGEPILLNKHSGYPAECEWVGMENPEKSSYKVGDWVLMSGNADGLGALPEDINNKTLQIVDIQHDHVYFNDCGKRFSSVLEEIVRKVDSPKENLLEEAKRRFPVGTSFGSLISNGQECIVKGGWKQVKENIFVKANRPFEGVTNAETYIYKDGKWATTPTQYFKKEEKAIDYLAEARRRYPKGTIYKTYGGTTYTIQDDAKFRDLGDGLIADSTTSSVIRYSNGEWAEIIGHEEEKVEVSSDDFRSYSWRVDLSDMRPKEECLKFVEKSPIESLPSEIIVKKKKKNGKKLIFS